MQFYGLSYNRQTAQPTNQYGFYARYTNVSVDLRQHIPCFGGCSRCGRGIFTALEKQSLASTLLNNACETPTI